MEKSVVKISLRDYDYLQHLRIYSESKIFEFIHLKSVHIERREEKRREERERGGERRDRWRLAR